MSDIDTDYLRGLLPPNTRVLVTVVTKNAEGTSRQMRVVATGFDLAPVDITDNVATALALRVGKYGVIVHGGGADMRYHLLRGLGNHLHGDPQSLRLA